MLTLRLWSISRGDLLWSSGGLLFLFHPFALAGGTSKSGMGLAVFQKHHDLVSPLPSTLTVRSLGPNQAFLRLQELPLGTAEALALGSVRSTVD